MAVIVPVSFSIPFPLHPGARRHLGLWSPWSCRACRLRVGWCQLQEQFWDAGTCLLRPEPGPAACLWGWLSFGI